MAMNSTAPAKLAYGAVFVLALPALLLFWERATRHLIAAPAYGSPALAAAAAGLGALLIVTAMWQLWTHGGGLPMNAFPPSRLVASTLFRCLPHPIYTGFTLLCWALSMQAASPSGLWLVTPLVALACASLVLGYERPDLLARFGASWQTATAFLPAVSEPHTSLPRRFRLILFTTLPWLLFAWLSGLPITPLIPLTLLPLFLTRGSSLRRLAIPSWIALAICLPFLRAPLLPWILLAASPAILFYERVWSVLRRASEAIANSWHEWRLGPVRIINHGFYAGLGTFVGLVLITAATGPALAAPVLLTVLAGVAGAGLWAQWIEGSPRLLRPYGFYGGLIGVALACIPFPEMWQLWAAHSLAGPVVQACGRLRCLIQGCCHGTPAQAGIGIVYHRAESRVTRMAQLQGVPLHPTQLYSILWNVFTFAVLARAWDAAAPLNLTSALWLILNGIGRFAEEAYRGEPQTAVFAGLRLYQWLAVASVLTGIAVSCVPGIAAAPALHWANVHWPLSAAGFLITSFALGVDFPASHRRFARLTQQ